MDIPSSNLFRQQQQRWTPYMVDNSGNSRLTSYINNNVNENYPQHYTPVEIMNNNNVVYDQNLFHVANTTSPPNTPKAKFYNSNSHNNSPYFSSPQHHHYLNNNKYLNYDFISIKSKIGVEYRRYSLQREDVQSFENFYKKIEQFHQLSAIPFVVFYTDAENFFLPINNDDNLAKAITSAKHIILHDSQAVPFKRPFLKLFIEKKGTFVDYCNGKYKKNHRPSIGMPEDFRQVSSIIDVDIVPETCRRVRIVKHGSDKPLGFYIRDGTYERFNAHGQLELVTGTFISRLVPGGLAESTGLLAVNDEVLEVNGIQITRGKTLDQVTDMMIANSSNLILTIRPGKLNNL